MNRTWNSVSGSLCVLLVCCFCGIVSAQPDVAVPGQRVGNIKLGETRSVVHKALGRPTQATRLTGKVREEVYLGPQPPLNKDGSAGDQSRLVILYEKERVVQIEFNSPRFLVWGLSLRNTLGEFRRTFPRARPHQLLYRDGGSRDSSGHVDVIFDDRAAGIAFLIGTQDDVQNQYKPDRIRIHRRGVSDIVDPGGEKVVEPVVIPR